MSRLESTPSEAIGGAGTKAGERRNSYRQPAAAAAVLHLCDEAEKTGAAGAAPSKSDESATIPVHIFNLSMYDVGFSAASKLPIGQVCRLEVANGRSGTSLIQIRSVRPRPDGLYDIGGRFC